MKNQNEIIVYQPDETLKLEVKVENETVWLTQSQLVELFQSSKANISEHLKNIFDTKELDKISTVRKFRTVQIEGGRTVNRNLDHYNLDVIISVGYRVNTKRGIQFRQWASRILKDYLLKGYSINQRFERIEYRLAQHDEKIDLLIRTSIPPKEGIFFEGQIFDAYTFVCELIRSAAKRIILVDNYVDETILTLLDKRNDAVSAKIVTDKISNKLKLDLEKHNQQYPQIQILKSNNIHDRFIIIDDSVYHIGASIKDLGKKLFAFSKLELLSADNLIRHIMN